MLSGTIPLFFRNSCNCVNFPSHFMKNRQMLLKKCTATRCSLFPLCTVKWKFFLLPLLSLLLLLLLLLLFYHYFNYCSLYIKSVQYSYNVPIATNRLSNEFRNFSLCNRSLLFETFLFQFVHNSYALPYTLFIEDHAL